MIDIIVCVQLGLIGILVGGCLDKLTDIRNDARAKDPR